MRVILGIDSSCYTSSAAIVSEDGQLLAQERMLLPVPQGERGLRQSEAVFAHLSNFPALLGKLWQACPTAALVAVCASAQPRDGESSYMPVFRSGQSIAQSIAATHRVPCYLTSHQQGHLAAASIGLVALPPDYLAMHLSGGTTDLLHMQGDELRLLGSSLDLHMGQLVDRIGVALGLPFPSGPALERLAIRGQVHGRYAAVLRDGHCSLSGAETQTLADIRDRTLCPEDIAAEVYDLLARVVSKMLIVGRGLTGLEDALLFGGVASSALLRSTLTHRMGQRARGMRLHFGKQELSGDNAAGVAVLGALRYQQERGRKT